ncbi:hypothetical protein JVU11DRAFT_10976 [Chiua virens]|nr:hypothetical protein JVU11DRAFT_10976 [Chiua virens]
MLLPSPTQDLEDEQAFSISLTVYLKVKKVLWGKSTSKEEKSVKTKELSFAIKPSNAGCVNFLMSMLQKHGQDDYMVTEKKHYPFQYTLLKVKGQQAAGAIDVDNLAEYQEMVMKIVDLESKPSTVKIFVDMRHIQKLPRAQASSGDDLQHSSDDTGGKAHSTKTDLNTCVAQWHIKLQQKYKNEHDEGLTYVGPLGALPLTLAMVLDWARALEVGQATLLIPPNIKSFNPMNKAPILSHARRASAQTAPSPSPAIDINSLTSVLLIQTLAQSGLLPSIAGAVTSNLGISAQAGMPHALAPSPQIPTRQKNLSGTASSPPLVPSPSHLICYLKHAEAHLGVHNALLYRSSLENNGISPNILPDVKDKFLTDLGILLAGDVICLKKGSMVWWNGPDAKQKQSNTVTSEDEQPVKRVAYQKRFHDGGGSRFTGLPMMPGSLPLLDYDLLYFCDAQNQWLPIPCGFIVVEDDEPSQLVL